MTDTTERTPDHGQTRDDEQTPDEATDLETAETADDSPAAPRQWVRPALWSVVAALILVLAGLSLFFWLGHRSSAEVDDATPAVLAATREGTIAVLTYHAATVDADVATAKNLLTGVFADEYGSLARTDVLPAAKERGLSSTVHLSGVSLVTADEDEAETMVFVTQQVSSGKQNEDPTTTATAIRVGLVKQGDRWLIETFQPI